jgi:predicted acetyltransferase
MTRRSDRISATIEVIPAAPDEEAILANLLELYMHDFSEFNDIELGEDGRFGYKSLSLYWREPDRHPFLIRMNGKLAGLVLVKRGPDFSNKQTIWDMAEFFIVRGYRRRGIGTGTGYEVWRRFPELWQVRVMESNHSAHQFRAHAIAEFAGEAVPSVRVERGGKGWRVFSFESRLVP